MGIGAEGYGVLHAAYQDQRAGLAQEDSWLDCSRQHEAVLHAVERTRTDRARIKKKANELPAQFEKKYRFTLYERGKQTQIRLNFGDCDGQAALVEALAQMKGNQICHWLAFLKQAQRSKGQTFAWDLREHQQNLGQKASWLRDKRSREDTLRGAVALLRLELECTTTIDGQEKGFRGPLIVTSGEFFTREEEVIEDGRDDGIKVTHVVSEIRDGYFAKINSVLFRGAWDDGKPGRLRFPVSPGLPACKPSAAALGAILAIRWHHDLFGRQPKDHVALSGQKALELCGIGEKYRRNDPSKAWASLYRSLKELQKARHLGEWDWSSRPEQLDGVLRFFPHPDLLDKTVLELHPIPPPPSTGAELKSWRQDRKMAQDEAAKFLGVGLNTVNRAEKSPDKRLSRAFKKVQPDRWSSTD
jgi:DNA-binding XRE family transcriptional regulator